MIKTLVTGFSPFAGRNVNASWIAAQSLAGEPNVQVLEIPVIWGKPVGILGAVCRHNCPELIVSMGEGRERWFDIETVARNQRRTRPDNRGALPNTPVIDRGPSTIAASIDALGLQRRLRAQHLPVRVSGDAGAFLCEETLYTLEVLRDRHAALATVVFVHLPPYGTRVTLGDETTPCTERVLTRFARSLYNAVIELHLQSALPAPEALQSDPS